MSLKEQFDTALEKYTKIVRVRLFGANNERIDFIMDSFYKLTPQQRNGAFAIGIAAFVGFICAAFLLYFAEVRALERDLSQSLAATQELKKFKALDQLEGKRFAKLVDTIKGKTATLSFKPFFEKMTKEKGITPKDLVEKENELDSSNALSESLKEIQLEMRISQISIPRLLSFITDVEKSENYIRLKDMKITGQYGNKLYFDTTLIFRGYSPKK